MKVSDSNSTPELHAVSQDAQPQNERGDPLAGHIPQVGLTCVALFVLLLWQGRQFSGLYFEGTLRELASAANMVELFVPMLLFTVSNTSVQLDLLGSAKGTYAGRVLDVIGCNVAALAGFGWLFWVLVGQAEGILRTGNHPVLSALLFYFLVAPICVIGCATAIFAVSFLWCFLCELIDTRVHSNG